MQTRGRTRWVALFAFALGLVIVPAAPALAASGSAQTQVILKGHADVARGDTAASVVIFDGPARIDGTVTGSVVAFHGPVTVSGTVKGSVISFSNRVVLLSGAIVEGDVHSQTTAVIAPDATVGGTIGTVDYSKWNQAAWVSRFLWWVSVTISTLALGALSLLLPGRAHERLAGATSRVGASIGWGLLGFFCIPIAAIILMVLIVTLPLGLALLAGLALMYLSGYVACAWVLGRVIVKRAAPFLAFLVGWGILRVVGLVPILGGTVWTLATIFGLGAIAVAVWSRTVPAPEAAAEQAPPAVPAIPAPPPPA